jgi:hypothetical protein
MTSAEIERTTEIHYTKKVFSGNVEKSENQSGSLLRSFL